MMNLVKKIVGVSAAVAIFLTAACHSFSISPLKYHLTLAPGSVNSDPFITVSNSSSGTMAFEVKVLSARQLDNGRLVYEELSEGARLWVTPNKKAFQLKPQSEERVGFKISVPSDAVAGSYYLGLAVQSGGVDAEKNVGVSGQLVSVLLLQVSGVVNETLSVQKWSLPEFTVATKWPASLAVVNTSVTELPLQGEMIIRDWLDREVAREDIVFGAPLLPGSGRNYATDIKLTKKFLLPGIYDAEVKIKYGLTKQSAVALKSVWYVPPYFWVLVVGLIAIGIILYKQRKKMAYVK